MKHIKKAVTLFLAFAMVLAMSASAFAITGTGDKSITLTGGKAGHTYTLYQLFTGKVEDGQLTNIQWGDGVTAAFKGTKTAAAYAKEIATKNDARATAQELVAADALTNGTDKVLSADGNVVFSNLPEGYYVIVDTSGPAQPTDGDYDSAYIVKVVENVTGEIKGSAATSDKEVADAGEADAAAYNIGDAVPFTLKATTADNVAAYKKYHITFQDKQSNGLDAPTSFTVTVLGKEFTVPASGNDPDPQTTANGTKITVTKVTPDSGNTFAIKVEFEPDDPDTTDDTPAATYLDAECNSKPITVDYTSVLNSDAEIGLPGNDNKMHITYSNNPEDEDGGDEGKTPDDTVIVFTFKTVADKVDDEGKPLKGAAFKIYREVAEGTANAVKGSDITFANGVEHSKINADKYYVELAMTGNDAGTQFTLEGLADGKYVIVETAIPEGYNAFASSEFEITSTVTETGGITTLTGGAPFINTNPGEDRAVEFTKKNGSKHALDSGELYGEIVNKSGAVLPSTGGIGTVIFYAIGSLLVIGCGIVLISRKRTNN